MYRELDEGPWETEDDAPTPPPARGEELQRWAAAKPLPVGVNLGHGDRLLHAARNERNALAARLTATEARLAEALQQRDEAVAIAREAIEKRDSSAVSTSSLRARLAKIGGEDG